MQEMGGIRAGKQMWRTGGVRRILDTGKSFQVSVSVSESEKPLDVEVSRRRFHDLALNVGDAILIRVNPNGPA